tara:strand:- start:2207 stop:2476 length:270 start_codon:yes stop_codon:yes gene_type:complete
MKKKKTLTPFEQVTSHNKSFAINMYTFYLFQKSCTELLKVDKFIEESMKFADHEEAIDKLLIEHEKNAAAWDMIMQVDVLSGSACYAEA